MSHFEGFHVGLKVLKQVEHENICKNDTSIAKSYTLKGSDQEVSFPFQDGAIGPPTMALPFIP